MEKFSKKREIVRECISGRTDHPTAQDLYDSVRKIDKKVSLATVYRNLNMLVENGVLKKISINNEDHFDPFLETHVHFICDKCGKIFDIPVSDELKKIEKKLEKSIDGEIDSCELVFHGICKKCRKNIK